MIHPIRTVAAFLVLTVVIAHAVAGLKLTEKPEGWQLTAGTKVTGYATYEECLQAIRVLGPGDYKCKNVTAVKAEFTCDDVPMPVMPTVVNAEGFIERPGITGVVTDDGAGKVITVTMEEGFVRGTFPNCWVPGLVPYDGKFRAPDGPPSNDPGPWVYTVDPEWPIGGKCPAQKDGKNDPNLCYSPPNPPIPAAP